MKKSIQLAFLSLKLSRLPKRTSSLTMEKFELITIDDFMRNTLFLFKTAAITPYYGYTFKYPSKIERMFYVILFLISVIQFIGEVTYVSKYFPELAVIDFTEVVSHVGFGALCFTKVTIISIYRKTISKLMFNLKTMFPKTAYLQEQFQVRKYLKTVLKTSKYWISYFFLAHMGFTIVPICQSCFDYYLTGNFSYLTPVRACYPFSYYKDPLIYSIVYFHQFWGVYWIGCLILCTDLLLGSTLLQVCMHYDSIGKQFSEVGKGQGDMETIRYLGRYHWIVTR